MRGPELQERFHCPAGTELQDESQQRVNADDGSDGNRILAIAHRERDAGRRHEQERGTTPAELCEQYLQGRARWRRSEPIGSELDETRGGVG